MVCTGIADAGSAAIALATRTAAVHEAHAISSSRSPAHGHSGDSIPPVRPAISAVSTAGTTGTSVTAPRTGTIPKVAATTGRVVTWSPARPPTASPIRRSPSGSAAANHAPASGPKTTTPATAMTPSCRPTSNTLRGSSPTSTTTVAASPASTSRLRPIRLASHAPATRISARTTAILSPVAMANAVPARRTATACARR
jgi:hypothetical protein